MPGYACPEGSNSAYFTPCPAGTYSDEFGLGECLTCPKGFFCNETTIHPELCPQGYYCPEGVNQPINCIEGTFGGEMGLGHENECTLCFPGQYCS